MAAEDKRNQGLMKAIRRVHDLVEREDIDKYRQSQASLGKLFGASKEISFDPVEVETISCEWVRLNRRHMKKQIILYCHGGGFMTGSVMYARSLTTKLALTASMDVFCFDYRLAPEQPYPAALEDAVKVWDYLMHLGYGSRDVIVAGDSAGGNLCLTLTLKLMEQKRMLPRGLILLSPWTDMTRSGDSYMKKKEIDPILSHEYMDNAVMSYAGEQEKDNPYMSPLFGELRGFPPVYIQVGENEILLDDSIRLHKKLIRQKNFSRLDIFEGMWHVFQMSPFKTANEALDKIADFIFDICS